PIILGKRYRHGKPMILILGLESSGAVWDGAVSHYGNSYRMHVLTLAGFAREAPAPGLQLQDVRDGIIGYIRDNKLDPRPRGSPPRDSSPFGLPPLLQTSWAPSCGWKACRSSRPYSVPSRYGDRVDVSRGLRSGRIFRTSSQKRAQIPGMANGRPCAPFFW